MSRTHSYSLGFISDAAIRDIAARTLSRRINGWSSARLAELHRLIVCRAGEGWCADTGEFDLAHFELGARVRLVDRARSLGPAAIRRLSAEAARSADTCYIVETAAAGDIDEPWEADSRIRRISVSRLYGMVFGSPHAYPALAAAMPCIVDDVMADTPAPADPVAGVLAAAMARRLCMVCA